MNKWVGIGRLTKDAELKYLPGNGTAVSNFTFAVDRQFKNKDGQKEADFLPIVFFGKGAEALSTYLLKGTQIAIAGRIQTRNYEGKDGKKVYITEIVAEEIKLLGNGKQEGRPAPKPESTKESNYEDMTPIEDGDIPF